jgi:hypothetical protein
LWPLLRTYYWCWNLCYTHVMVENPTVWRERT